MWRADSGGMSACYLGLRGNDDLGGGIRATGGWSGSGIHMAKMGGRIAAYAFAGETGDWDVLARMPTPAFPGGDWFRMPLLRLAMFWYGLRDRL